MRYIESLRSSLEELIKTDERIYLIGEDIAEPYGGAFKVTKGLSTKFPNRLIQTPMSEQGFTGLSVGMSMSGLKPIVEIMFCDFLTLSADQLINHLAKFHQMYEKKVNFVLRTPTGGYRGYGATHSQNLESLFFNIPGIEIISPSILLDPGKLIKESINYGIPVLFIENKLDYSKEIINEGLYKDFIEISILSNNSWPLAKTSISEEKPEISLISYGGMTKMLLELQEELFIDEEISIEILSLSSINKIDFDQLNENISSDMILTIEEGWKNFGWGNNILSELMQRKSYKSIASIGAKDYYIPASKSLEEYILPTKQDIKRKIMELVV